ncbi:MAG: hypothetical protein JW881_02840 [Spirochaetales bacterium]|nr:hypothetical protein [Spirochaetales bacterium]
MNHTKNPLFIILCASISLCTANDIHAQSENSLFKFGLEKALVLSDSLHYRSATSTDVQERTITNTFQAGYFFTDALSLFLTVPFSCAIYSIKNINKEAAYETQAFLRLENSSAALHYKLDFSRMTLKVIAGLEIPSMAAVCDYSSIDNPGDVLISFDSEYSDAALDDLRMLTLLAGETCCFTIDPVILFVSLNISYPLWREKDTEAIYTTFKSQLIQSLYFIVNDSISLFYDIGIMLYKGENAAMIETYVVNGGCNILISPTTEIGLNVMTAFSGNTAFPGLGVTLTKIIKAEGSDAGIPESR